MARLTVPEPDPSLPHIGYWGAFKQAAYGTYGSPNPYAQLRFTWCTDKDDKVSAEGFCHHLYGREVFGFEDGQRWLYSKLVIECTGHEFVYNEHGIGQCTKCPLREHKNAHDRPTANRSQTLGA